MQALGKSGTVKKVYADGDLRVQQLDDGLSWTLNPKCVKLERSSTATAAVATERSNSMMDLSHQRSDHVMQPLSGLSGTSAADKLVREAAQGRLEYVKQYLDAHPDQVNCMSAGKTCLQVAAHQGHMSIIKYLLSMKAKVNIVDKELDSTLHYAAFGNQPEIMKTLLVHGANVNVTNKSQCTALHISAHKRPPHCVKVLLEFNADVNIQDSYGDTALHDAIGKENAEVVELLCNAPNLDLTIRNHRGFNALHHASLKGNLAATRRILQLSPQLVDVKKEDGFAPLHLASLNGHATVVGVLVRDGGADINVRNNRRQTPFLLAVSQGHTAAIEKLVELGCDVLAKDEDGDNAMHLCVIKKSNLVQEVTAADAPTIFGIYQSLAHCHENRLMYAILCYLAQSGCKLDQNNKGNSILHWISDKEMQDLILSYVSRQMHDTSHSDAEQLYTNLPALSLGDSGNGNNSNNSYSDDSAAGPSNQATPLRRQHHRDQSNASPLTIATNGAEMGANTSNTPNILTNSDSAASTSSAAGDSAAASTSANHMMNNLHAMTTSATTTIENDITKDNSNTSHRNRDGIAITGPTGTTENIVGVEPIAKIINQNHSGTPNECIVCNEILPLIVFDPCSHQIACAECSVRMKKCLSCGQLIENRRTHHGRQFMKIETIVAASPAIQSHMHINHMARVPPHLDRLRYLESKIMEFEETRSCGICMERERNIAFLCGHGCCSRCAETLKTCHMCREKIVKKINLY